MSSPRFPSPERLSRWIQEMMMNRNWFLFAAMTTALSISFNPQAYAEDGVKAGTLTCDVSSGWGFVFGSSRDIKCIYSHGADQYTGKIKKFGVDIGYVSGAVMAWTVIAPTSDVGKGALAGDYGGATGSVAAGVGVGANVLVGGFQKSFTLQPLSVEGQVGLNVAGGIAAMTLEYHPAK
jgi:hypothetical protein